MSLLSFYLYLIGFAFSVSAKSQTDSLRAEVVKSLSKDLYKYYVSKEEAQKMCNDILQKFNMGGYGRSLNTDEYLFEITKDLRRISRDNHITISAPIFEPDSKTEKLETITKREKRKSLTKNGFNMEKFDKEYKERTRDDNFRYGDIKILPGNIGYVEIVDFKSTAYYKKKNKDRIPIEYVFNFLQNTGSIIIDLRENNGGSTDQAVKFCSYFSKVPGSYFITDETHFRYDSSGIEKEYVITRKRYTDFTITNKFIEKKSIYILISKRTFSAAELVAYKLKQYTPGNVTIIGENTMGGGNGFSGPIYTNYYAAIIPSTKSFDEANSNFNLEGKGISPDIFSEADSAFQIAYRLTSNENLDIPKQKVKYLKKTKPLEINSSFEKFYSDYVGNYRKISVHINNGRLYMLYDTFKKCSLIPGTKDLFHTECFDGVRFVRNSNNQVIEIQIKHTDGYLEKFRRL